MIELSFVPSYPYTIEPYKWTYRLSLGLILSWRDLNDVAEFARRRGGYGNTDSGFGLEYPTRPERAGQVRFWRWTWRVKGRIKSRKYNFPEADYLATLVALLKVRGLDTQGLESPQLPEVRLEQTPDRYDISNYRFNQHLSYDVLQALRMILNQRDFQLAKSRAQARQGFSLEDGSRLEYQNGGKIRLFLQRGHIQDIDEALYLHLLESASSLTAESLTTKLDETVV